MPLAISLALGLAGCATSPVGRTALTPDAAVAAAVADQARPVADIERDALRKPAQMIAFAGVKPGDSVVEFIPGSGYYTRLLAKTVGPSGHVYAIVPAMMAQRPGAMDPINAIAAANPNVSVITGDLDTFTIPAPADVAWTSENYHDLHNGPNADPAAFDRAVYAALKPGGTFFVEDHSAPGTGLAAASTLHRIDPAVVRSEMAAAGFVLDGQSDALANPQDPHDVKVFDPTIKGRTDKFALRFRKPG